jgi:CHASE3 domain sensor protein
MIRHQVSKWFVFAVLSSAVFVNASFAQNNKVRQAKKKTCKHTATE